MPMPGRNPSQTSRRFSAFLLAIIAAGLFGSAALAPQAARAQGIPVIDAAGDSAAAVSAAANTTTAINSNVISAASVNTSAQASIKTGVDAKQSAWSLLKISLTNTAILALMNGANYFAQKLAYDTATAIASGDKGQKPLFSVDGIEGEMKSAAADSAGEILGTLSTDPSLSKFGLNLCAPSDPRVALNIKLGFLSSLPGILGNAGVPAPQPKCTWDSISNNWDQFTSQDSSKVLSQVGVMFTPGQSSLSSAIEVNNASIALMNQKQEAAVSKFVADSGFKAVTDKISGRIKTPAENIKEQQSEALKASGKAVDQNTVLSSAAIQAGSFGILTAALQTFAGTLSQKLLGKVFKSGLISLQSLFGGPNDTTLTFDAAPPLGGQQAAELANASLLTPNILSVTNYDALSEYSACPNDGPRNPNNCVIDGQFFTAVTRAEQGAPLTVRQAVEQGFLQGSWPLLPLAHKENLDRNCYSQAFCYSNLVKLRKASVLPIGWELAANSPFNDLSHPVTLSEAMDHFEDCPRNPDGTLDASKLPDSLHPWCHLVDPEWVLKYPSEICRQQAPGPTLVSSDSAARAASCVDQTTCISQDASGNCVGGYGYCVREKNAWNIDGDSCPAYYASCTSFTRADGAQASFLANTLDAGPCNSQNAGCRQYSQSPNAVPNPGFEDVIDGLPRDWTLDAGARFSRSGLLAEHGSGSIGVMNGAGARAQVYSLQPGTHYALSASVLQQLPSANPVGTVTLKFFNQAGTSVAPATAAKPLITNCASLSSGTAVSLDIPATHLGFLSGSCTFTAPADATAGQIVISGNSTSSGNLTWFDSIGLYGGTFSASPYDSLFLNGKLQKCASDQAGCTDLVRLTTATLNLLRDPGFEAAAPSGGPLYWNIAPSAYEKGTLKGFEGTSAIRLTAAGASQNAYGLLGEAAYAFSVYSKADGTTAGNPHADIQLYDSSQPPKPVAPTTVGTGCVLSGTSIRAALATGAGYNRTTCAFTTPSDAAFANVKLSADDGSTVLADAAQLELSVAATEYHEGYSAGASHTYLKVAPEGLNCTGPNRDPSCDSYAPACRRDEVGCDAYTPKDGGTPIPAVTTAGDACPTACVGYDTFREEPSNFNDARFPLFLIPTTAQSCTAAEAGCSEFTNVQKLAQGGEAREYFSYLRLCAKPDENAATFYTWEGNDARGYQLRTWNLLKSDLTAAAGGGTSSSDPTGGTAPCTKLTYDSAGKPACGDDAASLAAASCVKSDLQFNPDCREFYDADGNIHYRLYSKTVVVSDSCTEYRITNSTQAECQAHGGFAKNGECHYFSYSPESQSCRPAAAGCRAYSGNASRNVRIVTDDGFEDRATDGWTATPGGAAAADVINSDESVTAGGHSLKVSRPTVSKDVSGTVTVGKSYLLTFWAKGTGDLTVGFSSAGDHSFTFNRTTNAEAPIALGTEWRPFQVGPVLIARPPASNPADPTKDEQLAFGLNGSFAYFDNVSLQEISDDVYLVKDSWKTPAACDQTPAGDPSPQYMLGCRAYTNRLQAQVTLKSFDRICRAEAVGCEALYDTHHSASPFAQTFSAVCKLPSACALSGGAVSCPCQVDGQTVCQAIGGATSCRYDADDAVSSDHVSPDGDTVRVPADSVTYLVNDQRYSCAKENDGCTAMGDKLMNKERTAVQSWSTVYGLNVPAQYQDILCKKSELYCQAYTRNANGSSAYFKDPELRTCEFRSQTSGNSGWFKSGSDEPCYPDFLQAGSQYGIWKNSDSAYDAWVGICQPQFDMCKEFVDPTDTSASYPGGQPYYAIANDRLDTSTCQNRVSLTQSPSGAKTASACVLFRQTDDLIKNFDSAASYKASEDQHGALVSAVSGPLDDANVVLRVTRDRQCGEWLDCRSSETVFNPSSGNFQSVCTAYGLCAAYETIGNTTRCTRYVDSDYSGQTLSPKLYEARDTGWKGREFTSFAIPNEYPVNELVTMDVSSGADPAKPDMRLVRVTKDVCSGGYGASCGPTSDPGTCLGPVSGRKCVYPVDDGHKVQSENELKQVVTDAGYPATSCRAYPDENAPFPSSVADPNGWNLDAMELNAGNPVLIGPSKAFGSANVCQRRLVNGVETSSCECNYIVAKYGADTKYFPSDSSDLPLGYCSSGSYIGYECDPLASGARTKQNLSCCTKNPAPDPITGQPSNVIGAGCDDGGECTRLSKVDRVVGYQGQCLERDFTTPINGRNDEFACMTWRPVGLVGGSRDIFNQNQTAGYFTAADRHFYCVGPQGPWSLRFDINSATDRNIADNHDGTTVGPYDQYTNNYFGPGTVTHPNPDHMVNLSEKDPNKFDCNNVGDGTNDGGGWCVWPTDATGGHTPVKDGNGKSISCTDNTPCGSGNFCDLPSSTCVQSATKYRLDDNAVGVLGCYVMADGSSLQPGDNSITYPYIGPPVYKQQLLAITFQVSGSVDGAGNGTSPTNPHNDTREHCGADGTNDGENMVSINGQDRAGWPSDSVWADRISTHNNIDDYYFLTDESGWKIDPSNGQGQIVISAAFDKNNLLSAITIQAAVPDGNDGGSFGLNRMGFIFKPGCSEVAQVDQPGEFGATAAFTDTVNPYADFDKRTVVDPSNSTWHLEDACRPFGAIGSVASTPYDADTQTPRDPWTYVVARAGSPPPGVGTGKWVSDISQCTTTDYVKGAAYDLAAPASSQGAPTDSLRQLFRKVYGVWRYVPLVADHVPGQDGIYAPVSPVDSQNYDETPMVDDAALASRGEAVWYPPRVSAADTSSCDSAGHCKAGQIDSLTVNGHQKGTISGSDGAMPVTAKFFGWASHNAMPILQRNVLWGDLASAEPPAKGWYKNQKPYCSPDISDANAVGECVNAPGLTCAADSDCPGNGSCNLAAHQAHFGNTPGACNAAPFQFDHTYTCTLKDLKAMPKCDVTDDAKSAGNAPCYRTISDAPVCVYRPKVQIVDNWGWCNCSGSGACDNHGAYGSACSTTAASAAIVKPWTEYSGEIRLAPTAHDASVFLNGGSSASSAGPTYNGHAVDDVYTAVSGTTYGQRSLLADDALAPGAATGRQIVVVSPPAHGSLAGIDEPSFSGPGNQTYQIDPLGYFNYVVSGFPGGPFYHGPDGFTYEIIQDGAVSNIATVTITNP